MMAVYHPNGMTTALHDDGGIQLSNNFPKYYFRNHRLFALTIGFKLLIEAIKPKSMKLQIANTALPRSSRNKRSKTDMRVLALKIGATLIRSSSNPFSSPNKKAAQLIRKGHLDEFPFPEWIPLGVYRHPMTFELVGVNLLVLAARCEQKYIERRFLPIKKHPE